MSPPRRLTKDAASDVPSAWTADSKAVLFSSDRNGTVGIFKQEIGQDTAEPVMTRPGGASLPRLSADGDWILYRETAQAGGPASPVRLMRVSVGGGMPEPVLATRNDANFGCARAPATLCVISEASPDEKHLTLTAFDPLKGRGKVLRTIDKDPAADYSGYALSPDGSTVALARSGEPEFRTRLLSLTGGSDREIAVRGWPNLTSLYWAPEGSGLYHGSVSTRGGTLLREDTQRETRLGGARRHPSWERYQSEARILPRLT